MSPAAALLFSVVLLGFNALFVGAEFALISARRSEIEPRAEEGGRMARITISAMENVSLMMAGAQLGITLCTLGLGALAEPAIAHGLEAPFESIGIPDSLIHPAALVIALPQFAQAQSRPNILVIMGDDVGWMNVSSYGSDIMGVSTPNIDRIGKEGLRLGAFYAQPSCTAGRAAFITGQLPVRTGLTTVGTPGSPAGLKAEDITLADILTGVYPFLAIFILMFSAATSAVLNWTLRNQVDNTLIEAIGVVQREVAFSIGNSSDGTLHFGDLSMLEVNNLSTPGLFFQVWLTDPQSKRSYLYDSSWHLLGFGYAESLDARALDETQEIRRAVVVDDHRSLINI